MSAGRAERYNEVRAATEALTSGLSAEDCQVQSMPDVSPAKWHLAHTTWFFETFLLLPMLEGYRPLDPAFAVLFNSYYVGVGERHPRPSRGLLTRPSLDEVHAYRRHVDAAMRRLMETVAEPAWAWLVELGCQHEQQHQELILMDIQHVLSCNPLEPAYRRPDPAGEPSGPLAWSDHPGGLCEIGHGGDGFAFDNEGPRHRVWVEPFAVANRLVTAGEYLGFIEDGGYRRPELWLSDGWTTVEAQGWQAPLYWDKSGGQWTRFTLAGRRQVTLSEPVCHVSYYEAEAYARWAGARLPSEAEWELAAADPAMVQLYDTAWQWTASPYVGYPGYVPLKGAVGEYNGKFMINQQVLRGGSLATPAGHSRATYRNFFPPAARWLFGGIRLAKGWNGAAPRQAAPD
ncbi:MAG TPA: ergothioneine biosynthesis protein EgtB [Novosphingobium sp.]|nr:ergothioneine biosynthesis protein EgtB [Novosphingobium sp.]